MKFLSTLTLALAGFASADIGPRKTGKAFVTRTKLAKPLAVRGGAGPLDPSQVAKGATALALSSQSLHWLVPEKAMAVFLGIKDPTPQDVFLAQREWAIYLSASLMTYLRIFPETSVNKAIGFSTFPFIADVVRSVLNDDEKKIGISNVGQVVTVLAPLLLTAYVCLNDMEVANSVAKAGAVYNMIKGAWYVLDPKGSCKTWRITGGESMLTQGVARWVGIALFSYGLAMFGHVQGMDVLKVTGYIWIPTVLSLISDLSVEAEVEKVDLNKPLYVAWIIVGFVVIGTLAI